MFNTDIIFLKHKSKNTYLFIHPKALSTTKMIHQRNILKRKVFVTFYLEHNSIKYFVTNF